MASLARARAHVQLKNGHSSPTSRGTPPFFSSHCNQLINISLFTVATAQTHFLFNGSLCDQIDGVAMGSPLAHVLANLFTGHHEKLWLENFQGSEILFYRRYVDDTFCLFHSEHDAIIFFDYINSRHPNIRFTMELLRRSSSQITLFRCSS